MKIGVYKILNLTNKKFYIGSTSIIGFEKRWNKHVLDLNNNKHHSIYLQRAWNKYGKSNFDFIIVEECKKENCIKREQYYIDKMIPEYNICKNAGSTLGFKFSKLYCKKLKKLRRGNKNPFYGKTHTKETKKKLREYNIGKWRGENNPKYKKGYLIIGKKNPFYGKTHTNKMKEHFSDIKKGRFLSNFHPNFAGKYKFFHREHKEEICGMCDLVRKYKLNSSHVWSICNGKRKSHHGWICLGKE